MHDLNFTRTFINRILAGLLLILTVVFAAQAQPGSLDPTFNPEDAGFGTGVGASSTVRAVAVQQDGKVLIGGAFTTYHGVSRSRIARLNTDGSLDMGFSPGTGANADVRSIVLQPDGKIIIGGNFTTYSGTARNRIARLNSDGTLDTSFDPGAGANGLVHTVQLLADGTILVGGAFTSIHNTELNYIARLQSDGSLDTSFDPGAGASGIIHTSVLQPDGKLIVGGAFTSYNGTARNRIARLHADGALDTDFNPGTGASGIVYAALVQQDGKLVIGGAFTTFNGTARSRIARLHADGSLDTGFFPGTGAGSTVYALAEQGEGKILLGGGFTTYNGTPRNRIVRVENDGKLDTSFDPGAGAGGIVYAVTLQPDNRILIGGAFTSFNEIVKNRIALLDPNGGLDEEFDPGAGANGIIYAATVQNDGKVLIGGAFTAYNGVLVSRIARLHADGSLDSSFQPGVGPGADVRSVMLQPDGKILIGGSFKAYRGVSRNYIARLHADGSLDEEFDPGAGANGVIHSVRILNDGKIIIAGAFTSYNDVARNRIARLHANGTLDTGFDPGTGASGIVYAVAVEAGGKLFLGGAFTTFNGAARSRIARLHADGSLDTGFAPGTGASTDVRTVAVQPDGKILIGGNFITYNGTPRSRIARLNSDGTLDTAFDPGTGAGAIVHALKVQPEGKVLIGGDFTTYNGVATSRFARLQPDGSLDNTFDTRAGTNGIVHAIAVQPDGHLLIGGAFTSYDGTGRNRIARVLSETNPLSTGSEVAAATQVLVYPNPASESFVVRVADQAGAGLVHLALYNAQGVQVMYREVKASEAQSGVRLRTDSLAGGVYFLRISAAGRSHSHKLVIGN